MPRNKILVTIFRKLWSVIYALLCVVPPNILLERLLRKPTLDMNKYKRRSNDTAIVTGANRGIGAEIVKKLLQLEMHVIVGVRNLEQMKNVLKEIRDQGILTGSLEIIHLDFDYLASVRTFANEVILKGIPIQLLINNAGTMGTGSKLVITSDGNEQMLQCNALGPFLLNNLLLSQLVEGGTRECFASIVDVSSVTQYYGKIDFDDLNCRKWFDSNQAYANSKLIQTALNSYLGNKLRDYGVKVRANSVHPGITGVSFLYNISQHLGIFGALFRLASGKPVNGADEVLYVSLDPEVSRVSGKFYIRRKVDPEVPSLSTRVMERLWSTACDKVGIENVFKKLTAQEMNSQEIGIQELDRSSAIPTSKRSIKAVATAAPPPEVASTKLHVRYPETFRWEKKLFKGSTVAPAADKTTEQDKNLSSIGINSNDTSIDIDNQE